MNNYKTEQEKQDKEFEELIETLAMMVTHSEQGHYAKNETSVRELLKSYLLSRDQALLEAFKKDVGEMMKTPLAGNSIPFDWGVEDPETENKRKGYNQALEDLLSLLKDYNLNKSMPFEDTKEGQTHYENDGCGEPAHNHTDTSTQYEIPQMKGTLEALEKLNLNKDVI